MLQQLKCNNVVVPVRDRADVNLPLLADSCMQNHAVVCKPTLYTTPVQFSYVCKESQILKFLVS